MEREKQAESSRNAHPLLFLEAEIAASFLRENKSRVLQSWEDRTRELTPAARDLETIHLIDMLPRAVDELIERLANLEKHPRTTEGEGRIAQEHGAQRSKLESYTLEQVIDEYAILREVIFDTIEECGIVSPDTRNLIYRTIELDIKYAAAAFHNMKQKQAESQQAQFLAISQLDLELLKEEREVRERFVATLTHDLRNPLSAVKTSAQLLLRNKEIAPAIEKNAARILSSVDRADRMIEDLLDASRIRAGENLPIQIAPCDLHALAAETLYDLALLYGDRFRLKMEAPGIHGFWSSEALRRVLENLASNAIKYGSPTAPITVSLHQQNQLVTLSVHNEGPDLSSEDQLTLFKAFRRTKSAQTSGKVGWGLGLTLVRGIAEAHGGKATVKSGLNQGVTFSVNLPLDSRPYCDRAQRGTGDPSEVH